MITYTKNNFGMNIPMMHPVVLRILPYTNNVSEVEALEQEFRNMYSWCLENCKAKFYFFPAWTMKIGAEFEDDEDASLFALRWS